ncbi:MAG: hypothetical protein Q8N39_04790 [Pelolinea sp.]|nr:hypothetical protein [Pelolinea sp.]
MAKPNSPHRRRSDIGAANRPYSRAVGLSGLVISQAGWYRG